MKAVIVFCLALASASALPTLVKEEVVVGPGEGGAIIQGPETKALLNGPDGGVITAEASAGSIIVNPKPGGVVSAKTSAGYVAETVPVVAAPIAVAPAPIVHEPIVVEAPIAAPIAAPVAIASGTKLSGPSGEIETLGGTARISGPASTTYSDGHHVVETGNLVSELVHAAPVAVAAPIAKLAVPQVAVAQAPLLAAPIAHAPIGHAPISWGAAPLAHEVNYANVRLDAPIALEQAYLKQDHLW